MICDRDWKQGLHGGKHRITRTRVSTGDKPLSDWANWVILLIVSDWAASETLPDWEAWKWVFDRAQKAILGNSGYEPVLGSSGSSPKIDAGSYTKSTRTVLFSASSGEQKDMLLDLLAQPVNGRGTELRVQHIQTEKKSRGKKNKITVIKVSDSPESQCSRGAAESSCGCAETTASAGWACDRRLKEERGGWLQAPLSWAGLDTSGRVKGGAGCLQRAQRAKQLRDARLSKYNRKHWDAHLRYNEGEGSRERDIISCILTKHPDTQMPTESINWSARQVMLWGWSWSL